MLDIDKVKLSSSWVTFTLVKVKLEFRILQ
jgi:hypothetical protein